MRLSYFLHRFNYIIVVVSVFVQIIDVLSEEEILTKQNLIVSTSSYFPSDDDFDVTTIYNITNSLIKNNTGVGFKNENFSSVYDGNSVIMYLRINSTNYLSDIITPLNTSNENVFKNNTYITFYPDTYWKYNYINTSGYYCAAKNIIDFPVESTTNCFEVFDYDNRAGIQNKSEVLTIEWQQQNHLNSLRITYLFKKNIYSDIEIDIYDKNNNKLYTSLLNADNITQLIIKSIRFDDDVKYKIIFSKKSTPNHTNIDDMKSFSIFQIANYFQTLDSGYTSKITSAVFPKIIQLSPLNIFGSSSGAKNNEISHNTETDLSANNCLNGGYRLKDRCVCLPGFRGVLCEEGCGSNSFGADCSGLCSMFTTTGCRGIYFCTSSYGCTCSAGLTGLYCDQDCPRNKYGANCDQNCSSECYDKTCDQYTGICIHSHVEREKSHNYTKKYVAYLRHPPKLLSAEYDTITLEIDFESKNIISNNGFTKVNYYQLLWKESNEDMYHYSKIKPFNSYISNEIVNGLKPGTTYNIGVQIIMDDGNLNEKNIVYGLYNTKCQENPSINEFNYQVMAGLRSIIITWDKVSISKQQCPIIELSLTLSMINHGRQNITHTFNIIPNSNHNYVIRDLVPGYEYSVNLTPRTSLGVLTSSHTSKVKPKFTDKDVTMKNITAKYIDQNKSISISWKPIINVCGLNSDIVDTFIVKYKINRIFSCSSKEIEEDWTSITINNSTDYDIKNVIPNSQYMIQVFVDSEDKKTTQKENIVYVLTPPSTPSLIPILEQPLEVTENSTIVKWKSENSNCSSINGIFKNFVIVLKNINGKTEQIIKTEYNNITFNDLKPMNTYELKIFVENHIGYSLEHFLLIKFISVIPVSDLVIYKMNTINRTLGLRWSCPDYKDVKQFIISIDNNTSKNVQNEAFIPELCSAWPAYYCHTISYLNLRDDFTIKVKAKLLENFESGETSVTFNSNTDNSNDQVPDPPKNLLIIETHETNVTLQWDIPWIFNGVMKSFTLYVSELKSLKNETCEEFKPEIIPFKEEQPTYYYTLKNLKPGSTYSIQVISHSDKVVNSKPASTTIKTLP